jgi:signal transduction histidine kinase
MASLGELTAGITHEIQNPLNFVNNFSETLRAGANFTSSRFVGTTGLRYEGAPAHDLFGQNDGLRRVGHIFSAEPGVQYKLKKSILYFFVPIPVDTATIQTVPDKRQQLQGLTQSHRGILRMYWYSLAIHLPFNYFTVINDFQKF